MTLTAVVLAVLMLSTTSTLGPAAPASAAGPSCVGIVVDGRLAGGGLRTACAPGDPRSGLAVLSATGFSYAFVPRFPGLVCQIDQLPECARTGTDTYWSYWHRDRGSSRWVYAAEGAGTLDPRPGSTDAWVWQDGGRRQPPAVAFADLCGSRCGSTDGGGAASSGPPTARPSRSPTARPTASTTSRPTGGSTAAAPTPTAATPTRARTGSPRSTVNPSGSSSEVTSQPTATAADPSTSATPAAAASPAVGAAAAASPAVGAAAEGDSTGPPWAGLVLGTALVGLLGSAALARSRRTRPSP